MGIRARSILTRLFLLAIAGSPFLSSGGPLSRYVTDETHSLTPTEQETLEQKLSDFDARTSTQVVVVMVSTLGSESLESVSLRIAEENGIGRKGKDNGVLLFVARDDRKIRIEVGYGLEGVLTDVISGQIIRHEIAPHFREARYFDGINAGVDAIMLATKNEYVADRSGGSRKGLNLLPIIFIVLFVIYISRGRRRSMIGGLPFMFFPGGGFTRGSGGWGGSGGGFSGGGGSFGGGGASGGW